MYVRENKRFLPVTAIDGRKNYWIISSLNDTLTPIYGKIKKGKKNTKGNNKKVKIIHYWSKKNKEGRYF